MPGAAGVARVAHLDLAAAGLADDRAAAGRLRAGDHPRQLALARAQQAGHADDLAGGDLDRDVAQPRAAQAADLEHVDGVLGSRRAAGHGLDRAPEHQLDQRPVRQAGGRRDVDDPAVAHDRDLVADAQDLVEAVRDEQHGIAAGGDLGGRAQDAVGLLAGEARGRLVEDQEAVAVRAASRRRARSPPASGWPAPARRSARRARPARRTGPAARRSPHAGRGRGSSPTGSGSRCPARCSPGRWRREQVLGLGGRRPCWWRPRRRAAAPRCRGRRDRRRPGS